MRARRVLLTAILSLGCLGGAASAAQADCSITWTGAAGDGAWSNPNNWSPAHTPVTTDDVCITQPGTYTVTLAPYTAETPLARPMGGDTVNSLTVGDPGGSGTQTLDISGQSWRDAGTNPYHFTDMVVTSTTAVGPSGHITLDSTNTGQPITGDPTGGDAILDPGTLTNAGTISTQSEDPADWAGQIGGTIVNTGTIAVGAGGLHSPTQNLGGTGGQNTISLTNTGTISTAAGSTYRIEEPHSGAAASAITNSGTITNAGDIVATNDGSGLTWNQSGGAINGNPIHIQYGTVLNDSAGTGAFIFDYSNTALLGTIPSGQTVTLAANSWITSMNETSNEQQVDLGGKTLTNDGTLVLESTAAGPGDPQGAIATITDGSIDNHGTIEAKVDAGSKFGINFVAGLDNEAGATTTLDDGTTTFGGATVNHGKYVLGAGALAQMGNGSSFTNAADGTLVPQIAGSSSEGLFSMQAGCCTAASTFTAGGAVTPTPVGGYVPAGNSEYQLVALNGGSFSGTFGTFSSGWTADYNHQTASPAYIGYVYGAPTPVHPGGGVTPVKPTTGVVKASGQAVKVPLTCPAGAACDPVTVTETATLKKTVKKKGKQKTVTTHVVVATCTATPVAGATKTLSCPLGKKGAALLRQHKSLRVKVVVTAGGATLTSKTVKLTAAKAKPKQPKPKRAK